MPKRVALIAILSFAALTATIWHFADLLFAQPVPYVRTPEGVVNEMLRLANITGTDVIYDLGSGDGRIVITAAQRFGARGVGIDINPARIAEANENAARAGVQDRVTFIQGDLFDADLAPATVVTMFLLPEVNARLKPKLFQELKPGARVVSHHFSMPDWEPEIQTIVEDRRVYLWRIPVR
jgi:cyclopropane fatty-acyl-phospholipid synthase-like methyltransferase